MNDNTLIENVIDYIETNLDEDLSLEKISKALNYSKFYIARAFAQQTNCTIYKYIQRRRLTIAAQKLVETNISVIEIAYEAHYSSQQAFNLAFRQLYLCTPQVYRKKGIFHPKQTRINLKSTFTYGGKMAA